MFFFTALASSVKETDLFACYLKGTRLTMGHTAVNARLRIAVGITILDQGVPMYRDVDYKLLKGSAMNGGQLSDEYETGPSQLGMVTDEV